MSTLNTTNITNGTDSITVEGAVKGSAKAWVNFNGTGVVAIRASFNVSSITDNGTGSYTVNFTTAMADTNWSGVITVGGIGGVFITRGVEDLTARTASSWTFFTANYSSGTTTDASWINVAIFR